MAYSNETYQKALEIINSRKQKAEFDAEVKKIMSGIKSNMTDVQKALYVHDYMVTNYSYDYNAYLNYMRGNKLAVPDEHYTAMGVMVNKTGVCQGYALAYSYLIN